MHLYRHILKKNYEAHLAKSRVKCLHRDNGSIVDNN